MRRARAALVLLAALAAGGPARAIDEHEQRERILFETREMEQKIERSGALLGDAALDGYLQSVVDRLYPDRPGQFRVRAVRDSRFNAFAVATGDLYVFTGLLLRVRNEAELAAVLGHEGGHVVKDHMYRSVRSAKRLGAIGVVVGSLTLGLGSIAAVSSMAGMSRDYEREADEVGFERMRAAGYDVHVGEGVFERMARERHALAEKDEGWMFASHPSLKERAQTFARLAHPVEAGGSLRTEEYLAATLAAREAALADISQRRNGAALVFLLGDESMVDEYRPDGVFLLGEGYRLRSASGDEPLALAAYRRSTEQYPEFAPAWNALGRQLARSGEKPEAIRCIERYLTLAPEGSEAAFARQTLEQLKAGAPQ